MKKKTKVFKLSTNANLPHLHENDSVTAVGQ